MSDTFSRYHPVVNFLFFALVLVFSMVLMHPVCLLISLLGAVLYFAVFPSRLDFSGSWLVAAYGGEMDAQTLRSQLGVSTLSYLLQNGLFAVLLAPAINMFPALGEEVGWRGYMMPRLKERFGLLNGRLLGGVVWGVWHWPLMLLVGYEYGTNYLGAPLLGLVVWCVVCFALNTLLDWLYEKTGCIWVPAAAHGAFNAIASIAQVLTYPADAYYNVLGPMPIGLIGMLPMLALAPFAAKLSLVPAVPNRIFHSLTGSYLPGRSISASASFPTCVSG